MTQLVKDRVKLLKEMNKYIINLGDEEVYEAWFSLGVPDEPTEEDYEFIAKDTKHFAFICSMLGQIVKRYDD